MEDVYLKGFLPTCNSKFSQKHSFDLQAAAEKIQRFEEKLRERESMAVFPNVLGAAFSAYDRKRRRERENHDGPKPWRLY